MKNVLPGKKTYIALASMLLPIWGNQIGMDITPETAGTWATVTLGLAAYFRSLA